MKTAKELRRAAREALSGRWKIAVIAGLIAATLGVVSLYPSIDIDMTNSNPIVSIQFGALTLKYHALSEFIIEHIPLYIIGMISVLLVYLLITSVVRVGYEKFNLDIADKCEEPQLSTLFSYFKQHWRSAVWTNFLMDMYTFLWGLLLVIPGIMARYSYAMTNFILAEHPELSADEAITRSKTMMNGHRWRLFCLEFSFIGWSILASLTLNIGHLWLNPYVHTARAAFYRDLCANLNPEIPAGECADACPENNQL